jgi:hypothetical protein
LKNFIVKKYQSEDIKIWNRFVMEAKNATFLFQRDFMDYHSDRFEDCSLLVFESEVLKAILPANNVGSQVFSHQGLTYGGLILNENVKLEAVIFIFKAILFYLNEQKITKLIIKQIPSIYCKAFSEELEYGLFLANAKLLRKDTLSVVDLHHKTGYSELRKRGIKKGEQNGLIVKEETNLDDFWNEILIPTLKNKHNAIPVHSIEEIKKLALLFKNIRQFNVYYNDKIVAGTTIFETEKVAHAQYIAANGSKTDLGSLDFLFDYLLSNIFKEKAFFDFGISNENNSKNLNSGLSYWKESFGAKTVVQNFYEVETANYKLLDDVLL